MRAAGRLWNGRRTRPAECIAHIGRARVLLRLDASGSRDEIARALARALTLVSETGARNNEPFVRVELARLATATGDVAARRHQVQAAQRLFGEMGATPRVERLAREFGG